MRATAIFLGILGFFNPAEKIGLKPYKEDVGQTLGSYGMGPGCYFVLPILGPTTARDSVGMIADTFIDPFAHVTLREKELFNISGNELDFYSIKGIGAVDFRSDNITNFALFCRNSQNILRCLEIICVPSSYLTLRTDWNNYWHKFYNYF